MFANNRECPKRVSSRAKSNHQRGYRLRNTIMRTVASQSPPEIPPETGEGLRVGQRAEMCRHFAIMLRPESDTPFHDPSI